jgi:hypothetical protein
MSVDWFHFISSKNPKRRIPKQKQNKDFQFFKIIILVKKKKCQKYLSLVLDQTLWTLLFVPWTCYVRDHPSTNCKKNRTEHGCFCLWDCVCLFVCVVVGKWGDKQLWWILDILWNESRQRVGVGGFLIFFSTKSCFEFWTIFFLHGWAHLGFCFESC